MINGREFRELFEPLLAYHGKKFNAAMASTWHNRLKFRSIIDIRKAIEEGKANHRSMPTLSEVCSYLPRYERPEDVPADERPIHLTESEEAFNRDLWPHFMVFSRDVQSPVAQSRLDAYDLWHMTFKGVCLKHKMGHLYDEQRWAELREIHVNRGD